jgi:hypothetical protein
MNKQLKSISILVAIFLILIIILSVLFFYFSNKNVSKELNVGNNTGTLSELKGNSNINKNDLFSNINELHYGNMPITYALNKSECGTIMTQRIKKAFDIINNETEGTVIFEDISDKLKNESAEADIIIHCYSGLEEENGLYTAGIATYSIEGTNTNLVTSSEINFYKVNPKSSNQFSGGCTGYPNTEIHEILHTFGFEHKEGYSIMNPVSDGCRITMIEKEIIDKLKEIYKQKV